MGGSVTITVDDRAARAAFDKLSAICERPPMREVAAEAEQLVRQAFREERDPWGTPWHAHSPLTLKARRKRGNASQQKLIDTGDMYGSIRAEHDDTNATVSIGRGMRTQNSRAEVNQFGTASAGRGRNVRIPARPYFPARTPGTVDMPAAWWGNLTLPVIRAIEKASGA